MLTDPRRRQGGFICEKCRAPFSGVTVRVMLCPECKHTAEQQRIAAAKRAARARKSQGVVVGTCTPSTDVVS
jgi:hypothetical protein